MVDGFVQTFINISSIRTNFQRVPSHEKRQQALCTVFTPVWLPPDYETCSQQEAVVACKEVAGVLSTCPGDGNPTRTTSPIATLPSPASPPSPQAPSMSTARTNENIGYGVGFGVGIPCLLIFAAFFLYLHYHKKALESRTERNGDTLSRSRRSSSAPQLPPQLPPRIIRRRPQDASSSSSDSSEPGMEPNIIEIAPRSVGHRGVESAPVVPAASVIHAHPRSRHRHGGGDEEAGGEANKVIDDQISIHDSGNTGEQQVQAQHVNLNSNGDIPLEDLNLQDAIHDSLQRPTQASAPLLRRGILKTVNRARSTSPKSDSTSAVQAQPPSEVNAEAPLWRRDTSRRARASSPDIQTRDLRARVGDAESSDSSDQPSGNGDQRPRWRDV